MGLQAEEAASISQAGAGSAQGRALMLHIGLKALTLCLATFLSIFGSLGQYFLIENYTDIIEARAAEMRAIQQQVSTLREAHGLYFTAYTQSNLLFALLPTREVPGADNNRLMYRLTLLDRGFPFRAILASLSNAKAVDFVVAREKYDALRDAAMKDFTYESYIALSNYEKDMVDKAGALTDTLQERLIAAEEEKAVAEAARDKRRSLMIVFSVAGTLLLLGANLVVERRNIQSANTT